MAYNLTYWHVRRARGFGLSFARRWFRRASCLHVHSCMPPTRFPPTYVRILTLWSIGREWFDKRVTYLLLLLDLLTSQYFKNLNVIIRPEASTREVKISDVARKWFVSLLRPPGSRFGIELSLIQRLFWHRNACIWYLGKTFALNPYLAFGVDRWIENRRVLSSSALAIGIAVSFFLIQSYNYLFLGTKIALATLSYGVKKTVGIVVSDLLIYITFYIYIDRFRRTLAIVPGMSMLHKSIYGRYVGSV